jgi:hypothetical protein
VAPGAGLDEYLPPRPSQRPASAPRTTTVQPLDVEPAREILGTRTARVKAAKAVRTVVVEDKLLAKYAPPDPASLEERARRDVIRASMKTMSMDEIVAVANASRVALGQPPSQHTTAEDNRRNYPGGYSREYLAEHPECWPRAHPERPADAPLPANLSPGDTNGFEPMSEVDEARAAAAQEEANENLLRIYEEAESAREAARIAALPLVTKWCQRCGDAVSGRGAELAAAQETHSLCHPNWEEHPMSRWLSKPTAYKSPKLKVSMPALASGTGPFMRRCLSCRARCTGGTAADLSFSMAAHIATDHGGVAPEWGPTETIT